MKEVQKPTMPHYQRYVLICIGSKCTENGEGLALYNDLKGKLKSRGLNTGEHKIIRSKASCFGTCKAGPLVSVQPDGVWYYNIDSEKLDKIIDQHLIGGVPVAELVYHQGPGTCK